MADETKLKLLDLFSGIGGFSLGLEASGHFETVAFCEINPKPHRVLRAHWPEVPIYEDVTTLSAERLRSDGIVVDAICGGFPCQDISSAGLGAGLDGERSGLWFDYARLICELRPRLVFVENVAALLGRGLDRVLGSLAEIGYDAEWHCIPAGHLGAPHERDRIWVIAYPAQESWVHQSDIGEDAQRLRNDETPWQASPWNEANPRVCRMDDGISYRVDRVEFLGNAVVPAVPELLGRVFGPVAIQPLAAPRTTSPEAVSLSPAR